MLYALPAQSPKAFEVLDLDSQESQEEDFELQACLCAKQRHLPFSSYRSLSILWMIEILHGPTYQNPIENYGSIVGSTYGQVGARFLSSRIPLVKPCRGSPAFQA